MTDPGGEGAGFRTGAPVVLREEREVKASPDRVWNALVRVERWPRWHRGIRFAALRGDPEPGAALYWRADGMRISSVLVEVEAERTLGWTIRTLGARGYQRWSLEPLPGGRTRVRLEESWEGLVVRILRRTLRRTLAASRKEWLRGLDREAAGGSEGGKRI